MPSITTQTIGPAAAPAASVNLAAVARVAAQVNRSEADKALQAENDVVSLSKHRDDSKRATDSPEKTDAPFATDTGPHKTTVSVKA